MRDYIETEVTCEVCRDPIGLIWDQGDRGASMPRKLCFTCGYWLEKVDRAKSGDPRVVRAAGEHYSIADENSTRSIRGSGGKTFRVRFDDGREVLTTNLWAQGEIPDLFRDLLPDNACIEQEPRS